MVVLVKNAHIEAKLALNLWKAYTRDREMLSVVYIIRDTVQGKDATACCGQEFWSIQRVMNLTVICLNDTLNTRVIHVCV